MRKHLTPGGAMSPSRGRGLLGSRKLAGFTALVTLGGLAAVTALAPGFGTASSHREAPLIAGDPQADNTDVYAFVSPDRPDTVTMVANWIPFSEPNGGPNFYSFAADARYNIKIDSDGDALPDTTYTWTFKNNTRDDANQFLYNTGPIKSLDDPNLNFFQTYTLTRARGSERTDLVTNAVVAPSNVGPASVPDYGTLVQQATKPLPDGGQTYVGQADDSFFLDLRVFDLLYGADLSETGTDTLSGYNVNTIVLQVPKNELAASGDSGANPVIGVWSTTERRGASVTSAAPGATESDGFVQVSRLGNPLVNEVVVPLKLKDAFNGLTPDKDRTVAPVVDKVLNPILPGLIQKVYNLPAPATPRNDLFEIFLTGICKECKAPDGTVALPIDLNSQMLNRDGKKGADFAPSEMLRLNMSIAPTASPNRLGVLAKDLAGFPNGRRLTDDVVDIALQAVEGAAQSGSLVQALATGDKVDQNDRSFRQSFPYVALPHTVAVNRSAGGSARPSVAASAGAGASTASGSSSTAGQSSAPVGGVAAGAGGTAGGPGLPILPIGAASAGVVLAGGAVMFGRRRHSWG